MLPEGTHRHHERPGPAEILIWCLRLSSLPLARMLECLSAIEREAAARVNAPGGFERWVKSRGALRLILGKHTRQAARDVAITESADTKPELVVNPLKLHFNVSHSGDFTLIALGGDPLGVDIEAVRLAFDWRSVAAHFFHPEEQRLLASAPPARGAELFFQIWTLKEACCKGAALTSLDGMAAFFVTPEGQSIWEITSPRPRLWHLISLEAPRGYSAALASLTPFPLVVDCTPSFPGSRPLPPRH